MASYVGEVPCAGGRLIATAQVTRGERRIELRVVPGRNGPPRAKRKGRHRRVDPEACYAEINGGPVLEASRRSRIGREERRALLDRVFPGLPLPRAPRGAGAADVLDALVCLWAAERTRFRLVRD